MTLETSTAVARRVRGPNMVQRANRRVARVVKAVVAFEIPFPDYHSHRDGIPVWVILIPGFGWAVALFLMVMWGLHIKDKVKEKVTLPRPNMSMVKDFVFGPDP